MNQVIDEFWQKVDLEVTRFPCYIKAAVTYLCCYAQPKINLNALNLVDVDAFIIKIQQTIRKFGTEIFVSSDMVERILYDMRKFLDVPEPRIADYELPYLYGIYIREIWSRKIYFEISKVNFFYE